MADVTKRAFAFREAINRFLKDRLDAKLDKLAQEDPKREALSAQYQRDAWLEDAARRVAQIQAVTHTLKPIHPDARGTNLFCAPAALPSHAEVGSHTLGDDFNVDVVGNAAALDVYKLLKLRVDERSLLEWLQTGDPAVLAALSDDATKAQDWCEAFVGITRPRSSTPSSHTLAKQLYWRIGDDPCRNSDYHLLAPLYSSALAHAVFHTIDEDRFGDAGKAARQARREHRHHDTGYREYPNLAVQKFGGTKPQNISQLNSERGGNNYLLASLPPSWKTRPVTPPLKADSVLPRFGRIPEVRQTMRELRDFLRTDPTANVDTRNRRDTLVERLIDELVDFAHPLQSTLPAGWTQDTECRLCEAERLWLDPGRAAENDPADADFCAAWHHMDWPAEVGKRFGNWLNAELGDTLPLGDIEGRHWRDELLLNAEWADELHRQRKRLETPTYIPVREATS